MIPSIYINLEDGVSDIATRLKREKSRQVVLVCPKRCSLFSDSINLKLLKKQADLLDKEVFILTMDEKGQAYAREAGFELRSLPKPGQSKTISDIKVQVREPEDAKIPVETKTHVLADAVQEIKNLAKVFTKTHQEVEEKPKFRSAVAAPSIQTQVSACEVAKNSPGEDKAVEDNVTPDAIFHAELVESFKIEKQKKRNQKTLMAFVAVTLLVILGVVFVVLPKATVAIYPKTQPVTRDMDISLSSHAVDPDSGRLILPAAKVSETMEVSDKFQSQGKKEIGSKALGTVRIFNFTRAPISLKAGTTVLTVGSKNYSLLADITQLRPTSYKNATSKEVDEASLAEPVEVAAVEGGESSNLPAGTRMEITNQVFGSRPQLLYAKTETAILGGVSRYLSVVSQDDLTASQNSLKEKLLGSVRNQLSEKKLVLLEKAYILESLEFVSDKPAGTESPNFTATLKARIIGMAYNSDQLHNLVFDRIKQTLAVNKKLEQSPEQDNSYVIKNMDFNNELGVLSVHFEGREIYNVDIKNLPGQLAGKTANQVNEILKSKSDIERIDVMLAPSWQRTFPWFANKIQVIVQN